MTSELLFRTEDIAIDEILDYFVETDEDRKALDSLKGRSAVILRGSRGVGKSFLLRVAEAEMLRDFRSMKVLPVYVTFARATLIANPSPERFLGWMTAKICNRIIRASTSMGLSLPGGTALASLRGDGGTHEPSTLEALEASLEESWKSPKDAPAGAPVPGPEALKDAVEDLCRHSGIKRITLLIDEAAHVFIPEQQRQFFTLMRDLRSPHLSIKAAVYPGATSFGDSFQPTHDASLISVDRSVTHDAYADSLRELVLRQDQTLERSIRVNGEVFDTLAYAATGNPRVLLKTVARSNPFNRRNVQETIREYFREEIWAEHSSLAERFPGHRALIDWGRTFIEGKVLPDLYARNKGKSELSSYLWIHRDAPQSVKEALRLLCYSGILLEGDSGIRATRSEPGTRYMVNLGCQIALDAEPVAYGTQLRQSLSVRRMIEYGANHRAYEPIDHLSQSDFDRDDNEALAARLQTSTDALDVTSFLRAKLDELNLKTISQVLEADEMTYKTAYYVGDVRARQIRNAAVAAVLEYLSG